MGNKWFTAVIGAGLILAPLALADSTKKPASANNDVRRAIEFQRQKDIADARQARKEARHPSVSYTDANRSADRSADEQNGRTVKDPGEGAWRKNK